MSVGTRVPGAKPPTQRQLRVAEEIRHVLAGVFLRGEIRDPELAGIPITVTEVRIGPDLKRATAFVTRLGRTDVAEKLPALRRAAPYLRAQVAKALMLRVAPDLSFQADTSIDYAMVVDGLLRRPEVARDLSAADDGGEGMMDARSAVGQAKAIVRQLFGEEEIENVGLEEVAFEQLHKRWRVTIGFSRPWERTRVLEGIAPVGRSYKVVSFHDDAPGEFAIENRDAPI